ncbi:MAG: tol-pal system protein YbgF [Burkholderiales bacterium RIFCSPLOWO2_02_FULL_57_36]|nr:MAG: tol-pal system protein YbgF [Burkholderiales bacterium RIFCSPLOWO2_02_FULL_57_36]
MKTPIKSILAAALIAASSIPMQSQAALFDDVEARRAIIDLRARVDSLNNRLEGKADKSTNLDLAGQNEQLRLEVARLRGQIEVLANDVANMQRRQKDFYTDLDTRLRKMEPQQATVDGRQVEILPAEQKTYDAALAMFKAGDYRNAGTTFSNFLRLYPQSGYAGAAHYWLGNTYYAQRDYRNAIASHQTVVNSFPDNPKAPEALLTIASSYVELKDKPAAKKTLEQVVARYPDSQAAQTAQERMAALR